MGRQSPSRTTGAAHRGAGWHRRASGHAGLTRRRGTARASSVPRRHRGLDDHRV